MTERKPPGQAKLDGERMFHLLMENVKDFAIFMLDPEGRIVSWNTGAERILGYTEPEILGRPFAVIFTPDDIERKRPEYELQTARETGRAEDECWHVRKDGSRLWASGVVTPLRDENGDLQGFAKILRDITERKRSEDQLEEANQRKDEFLAMLAHELRNPLAPIQNVVPIFKQEGGGKQHLKEATGMVERALGRIVRIVDDLLDVSRITRGKIELRKERLTLQTAVEQAVETVRPFIESRKHRLTVSLPQEAVWLDADPVRLDQVLVNLLNNAAKYTEPGGTIRLSAERLGNDCVVRVQDNGIGIGAEMLPRVFELFVQADKSLDRAHGGLGIGLTLVKRLVEMHGGAVEAHSGGVGQGSEFVVRLRAVPEVAGLKPEDAPARLPRPAKALRILVVDDNVDTAESLAMVLRLMGHDVRTEHTGPKALQAAVAERPDVVLLDIGLPGMDGCQVAERIREHQDLADMRLIAISGYGQQADQRRCEQAGFNHHLVKPVDPATFQQLL
ncbi:MAG TPA: PAS domain S-box protein [Gemmataceae bacterium]|nr:PAS domain S-box protein [Gemmataceae bacterium]